MKKLLTCLVVCLCFALPGFTQNLKLYKSLVKQGKALYEEGQYEKAGLAFSNAFAAVNGTGTIDDRYLSAAAWAMAKQKEKAFVDLFRIGRSGRFTKIEQLKSETAFQSLHDDPQWEELCTLVLSKKEHLEKDFIQPAARNLEKIYTDNKTLRNKIKVIGNEYGWDSDEVYEVYDKIIAQDSIHAATVSTILDEHGWKGPAFFGRYGSAAIIQSLRNASLPIQEKQLPLMRNAVEQGLAKNKDLISMEDKIALAQKQRQIYGSQIAFDDENNKYYVVPLDDPDGLASRRAALGLPPMAVYVKQWNIEWDLKRYKKELPKLQKKWAKEDVVYRKTHRMMYGPAVLTSKLKN